MLSKRGKHERVRKYPGNRGPRPDLKEFRQKEALDRQAAYDELSTAEKIEQLELKVSTGVRGQATKQLAKLKARLDAEKKARASAKR